MKLGTILSLLNKKSELTKLVFMSVLRGYSADKVHFTSFIKTCWDAV